MWERRTQHYYRCSCVKDATTGACSHGKQLTHSVSKQILVALNIVEACRIDPKTQACLISPRST